MFYHKFHLYSCSHFLILFLSFSLIYPLCVENLQIICYLRHMTDMHFPTSPSRNSSLDEDLLCSPTSLKTMDSYQMPSLGKHRISIESTIASPQTNSEDQELSTGSDFTANDSCECFKESQQCELGSKCQFEHEGQEARPSGKWLLENYPEMTLISGRRSLSFLQ